MMQHLHVVLRQELLYKDEMIRGYKYILEDNRTWYH